MPERKRKGALRVISSRLRATYRRTLRENTKVAIYHLSVSTISRSAGRSATAGAAYRAAEKIVDERTGEIHDYTRKQGVEHTELVLPGGGQADRAAFWNLVEKHHKRGDAVLVREVVIALPDELSRKERQKLAVEFSRELADRYGVAADLAIHAPGREGDNRNHHAHIMLSACLVKPDGTLGKKAVELDPIHCQRAKIANLADSAREQWADLANTALIWAGRPERIDHRSHAARGLAPELASVHMGPKASAIERRGEASERGERNRAIQGAAHAVGQLDQLGQAVKANQVEQVAAERTASLQAKVREFFLLGAENEGYGPEAQAKVLATAEDRIAAMTYTPEAMALAEKNLQGAKDASAKRQAERDARADVWTQWGKAQAEARAEILGKRQAEAKAGLGAVEAMQAAHERAKPLLFGRQGWESEREKLVEKARIANIRVKKVQPGADGKLEYHDEKELQAQASQRVRDKNPELAQRADAAQQAWREELARKEAQRVATWKAEREAQERSQAQKPRSRGR